VVERHYFDHNACTPVDRRVLERFLEVELAYPANPGSLHEAGRRSRGVVEEARYQVADTLGVSPDYVFFVSGGTEANNLIIRGAGDLALPVLASMAEHPSVLAAADRRGLVEWGILPDGTVRVTAPDQPVGLIALTHGQNEVGTLQPIAEAALVAETCAAPLHIDASQTLGRCKLTDVVLVADSITLSTHKAGGLRGCAVLIDRNPTIQPLLYGGAQQLARRPGTESASLIAATAFTVELAVSEQESRAKAMHTARDAFLTELESGWSHVLTPANSLPNTAMVLFDGIDSRALLPALDMAGIEVSQGSACSSGSPTPPTVLIAMGLSDDAARSCVRFSFSLHDNVTKVIQGARLVNSVIQKLREQP
jgi:cysteine desulfurase